MLKINRHQSGNKLFRRLMIRMFRTKEANLVLAPVALFHTTLFTGLVGFAFFHHSTFTLKSRLSKIT
jgi:hypothetical protein